VRVTRWLVAAMAVFAVGAVEAQICEGRPSFAVGGAQVSAGMAFGDGVSSFGGGFGMGASNGVYGSAVVGTTSYDGLNGSSFNVGGDLGYQIPAGSTGTLQLCPTGGFGFEFGPNDIEDTGFDASGWGARFGVQLGAALPAGEKLSVVPNGGLSFAHAKVKVEDAAGDTFIEGSENYGVLRLGLGFVIDSKVGLIPAVHIPIGLEDGEASFALNAVLNFGTPR
jgi:hypothetical protein